MNFALSGRKQKRGACKLRTLPLQVNRIEPLRQAAA